MFKFKKVVYLYQTFFIFLFFGIICSCSSSKKINSDYYYFKDAKDIVVEQQKELLIQPNDVISIVVYSRSLNQEQTTIFNLPVSTNTLMQGYQVSISGTVDMPVIGTIKVLGLTKKMLQDTIMGRLISYVKNPSVIIKFLQFNVHVLGEVHLPGTHKFNIDKVTIIDALSAAGDLTDYGRRDNIIVVREEDGKKITYPVDLRNKSVFNSPVYNLQPNDIIYVSPNKFKIKNLSVDPDVQRRTGLVITSISVAVSVATLLITVLKK